MSFEDEVDEYDKKMEDEYKEFFPPEKRRFTFTELREKYRKNKTKGGKNV